MSTATLSPTTKEQIPRAALRFREAGRAAVAFAKGKSGTTAETPITMLARSSEPIADHWYWGQFGWLAHDFGGMALRKETLALDYCHDPNEIIGVAATFAVKRDGLHVTGKLVSVVAGDRADEIAKKAAASVPYESSIDFYGAMTLERVGDHEVARVNGRELVGPGVIVRRWTLNGVAVCPLGADANSRAQLSRAAPGPLVSVAVDTVDSRAAALLRVGYSPALAKAAASMRFRKGGAARATGSPTALAGQAAGANGNTDAAEVGRLAARLGSRNLAAFASGIKMPGRRA